MLLIVQVCSPVWSRLDISINYSVCYRYIYLDLISEFAYSDVMSHDLPCYNLSLCVAVCSYNMQWLWLFVSMCYKHCVCVTLKYYVTGRCAEAKLLSPPRRLLIIFL